MREGSVTEITLARIREEWEAPLKAQIESLQAERDKARASLLRSATPLANAEIEKLRAERDRYAALLDELIEWPYLEAESIRAKAKELRKP